MTAIDDQLDTETGGTEVPTGQRESADALVVRALEVGYDATSVLRGVDLAVRRGEIVALLGPSGCGKTTLLRTVAGFLRPDSGSVELDGVEVAGPGTWVPPERRNVGIVPQEGALFPHLDVGHNVGFGLRSGSRSERAERVAECLELVGLAGEQRRRPGELSGGQQQRVAVARALAPHPSVVLLDEPFSALDAALRSSLREEVRSVLGAAGATAVLVTHDQEEALSFADRVAVMRSGRIAQFSDPVTLYRHPADRGVAAFVGESVEVSGTVVAPGRVRCAWGELDVEGDTAGVSGVAVGDVVEIVLRPEQLELVDPESTTARARVRSVTYFGHDALVHLQPDERGAELVARIHHHDIPAVGARVGVVVRGPVSAFRPED